MRRQLVLLTALWKANLLAAMEYRASFLSQALGMMLNNAVYFAVWIVFFDRFEAVRGWDLQDMVLLFAIVATGFGLAAYLFGNSLVLADVIAGGGLDYYLALPRPVLLHVLASRSRMSGLGDVAYGLLTFALAGAAGPASIGRFLLASALSMVVFLSFLVLIQSLTFWIGNASTLSGQTINALLTFSMYPITLFDGTAKFVLFTLLPAAFIGTVPAQLVHQFTWTGLARLLVAAGLLLALAALVFHRGLRKYESGSAVQVQV